MDKLDIIFNEQQLLQNKLGTKYNQEFINIMTLACIDELMESLRETPWKPWKINQVGDNNKYKRELIDVLHFFINLCLASGITSEDLYIRYMDKNKINHKRKENGY